MTRRSRESRHVNGHPGRRSAEMPSYQRAAPNLQNAPFAQHVQTLYLTDARPFSFEDRWVNLVAVPEFASATLKKTNPNEWLMQYALFALGTLDYSTIPASPNIATRLLCKPNTPLMVLERRTFGPDAAVTYVRLSYAPNHRLRLKI